MITIEQDTRPGCAAARVIDSNVVNVDANDDVRTNSNIGGHLELVRPPRPPPQVVRSGFVVLGRPFQGRRQSWNTCGSIRAPRNNLAPFLKLSARSRAWDSARGPPQPHEPETGFSPRSVNTRRAAARESVFRNSSSRLLVISTCRIRARAPAVQRAR